MGRVVDTGGNWQVNGGNAGRLPVGRHTADVGLYLQVNASGSRSWLVRIKTPTGRTMRAIGTFPAMTLAAARRAAIQAKAAALKEVRPEPSAAPATGGVTLRRLWEQYADVALAASKWTAAHHAKTVGQIELHVGSSALWHRPAASITRAELVELCVGISSRETGGRVYRWLRSAFEHAVDDGTLSASPCGATLPLSLTRPASDKGSLRGQITAISDLRDLLKRSWHFDASLSVRAAHRVIALTGHRVGAVVGTLVTEWDGTTFTVARGRMKIKDPRRPDFIISPASKPLADVLDQCAERAEAVGSPYLFPATDPQRHVIREAVEKHLNRLTGDKFTPHGWRSALFSWAIENGHGREVARAALDHLRAEDADRAYDMTTLRPAVSALLIAWAEVLT